MSDNNDYFSRELENSRQEMIQTAASVYCDYLIKQGESFSEDQQHIIIDGHKISVEPTRRDPEVLTELIMTLSNFLEANGGPESELHYESPIEIDNYSVLLPLTYNLPARADLPASQLKLPVMLTYDEYEKYVTKNSAAVKRKIIENHYSALEENGIIPDRAEVETFRVNRFGKEYDIMLEIIRAKTDSGENNFLVVAHATKTDYPDNYNFNIYHITKDAPSAEVVIKALTHYHAKTPAQPNNAAPGIVRTKIFGAATIPAALRFCAQLSSASNEYLKKTDYLMKHITHAENENLKISKILQTAAQVKSKSPAEKII